MSAGLSTLKRRCWGRTGPFWTRRCGRTVERRFCADHKTQWLYVPLIIVPALVGYVGSTLSIIQYINPLTREEVELRRTMYIEVSIAAHRWRQVYLTLNPERESLTRDTGARYASPWQQCQHVGLPHFTHENWVRYRPLFNEEVDIAKQRLQEVMAAYSDELMPETRIAIEATRSELSAVKNVYYWLQRWPEHPKTDQIFRSLFIEVFRCLEKIDAEARRLQDSLPDRRLSRALQQ